MVAQQNFWINDSMLVLLLGVVVGCVIPPALGSVIFSGLTGILSILVAVAIAGLDSTASPDILANAMLLRDAPADGYVVYRLVSAGYAFLVAAFVALGRTLLSPSSK